MTTEPNFSITGDEARILMVALRVAEVNAPIRTVLNLYMALAAIAQVQPPEATPQPVPLIKPPENDPHMRPEANAV